MQPAAVSAFDWSWRWAMRVSHQIPNQLAQKLHFEDFTNNFATKKAGTKHNHTHKQMNFWTHNLKAEELGETFF